MIKKIAAEIAGALLFGIIYFLSDQYWLHTDRTLQKNLQVAGIATVCFFILNSVIRRRMKRKKAAATGE